MLNICVSCFHSSRRTDLPDSTCRCGLLLKTHHNHLPSTLIHPYTHPENTSSATDIQAKLQSRLHNPEEEKTLFLNVCSNCLRSGPVSSDRYLSGDIELTYSFLQTQLRSDLLLLLLTHSTELRNSLAIKHPSSTWLLIHDTFLCGGAYHTRPYHRSVKSFQCRLTDTLINPFLHREEGFYHYIPGLVQAILCPFYRESECFDVLPFQLTIPPVHCAPNFHVHITPPIALTNESSCASKFLDLIRKL
jgi:hypothetical protein